MKALLVALVLGSVGSAFAANNGPVAATADLAAQFPESIKCTSGAISANAKSFSIEKLNTLMPEASITDQGLMDPMTVTKDKSSDRQRIQLGFSNECDNGYGVEFYAEDLIALKSGSLTQVYGALNYSDVDLEDATNNLVEEERLVITCTR